MKVKVEDDQIISTVALNTGHVLNMETGELTFNGKPCLFHNGKCIVMSDEEHTKYKDMMNGFKSLNYNGGISLDHIAEFWGMKWSPAKNSMENVRVVFEVCKKD